MLRSRGVSRPPSKLGLRPGETVTVEDAIKALVTRSANDVAATIAENISGSEKAFAARMTNTARALGMTRTTFRNASGLPDPKQVTSARDMATLSLRIQRDFPQYYPYFRITSFSYKGKAIRTHNRLLGKYPGTDGIKTGYIRASGFNLTTSVARKGKRLVGVVMGGKIGRSAKRLYDADAGQAFRKGDGIACNTIAAAAGTPPGLVRPACQWFHPSPPDRPPVPRRPRRNLHRYLTCRGARPEQQDVLPGPGVNWPRCCPKNAVNLGQLPRQRLPETRGNRAVAGSKLGGQRSGGQAKRRFGHQLDVSK